MSTPLVIDTDLGSDVDDAIAVALAVRHPELDLRAVTTVSSQPELRAQLAAGLLEVAGAAGVEVGVGRSAVGDERNAIGAEHVDVLAARARPVSSRDAVTVLAGQGPGTAIATIGQQTNLAAACDDDPRLAARAQSLTVMGGAFVPVRTPDGQVHGAERDWNFVLDPPAAVTALSRAWRTRFVPIDVTFRTALRERHLDRLRSGDELCRVLATLVEGWGARALPSGAGDVVALLHDPLAVACVVECEFVTVERVPVTVMLDAAGLARTVVDPVEGREAEVVRGVDAPAFADWLVDVLLA